ncbi:39S ribosomal protein L33, mitochondrial isoform X1 [Peromyscus californicus insignis]|uniref:39S ribosomal protein L33, mitochondrial isoform X1 n=1 Tax=Peromyscus californicus insignis TaxID=564181 RepID=UPI0022A79371|nr:39S ribosomal protein L33, mitochondrial isoform X1 [Peromyscus californicus insignis]
MLLSAVSFAKSKSKTILVRLVSQAGTGFSFNHKRSRLREKLTLLHYDPIGPKSTPSTALQPQTNQIGREELGPLLPSAQHSELR